jgi:uncharacterized membrane protein YfcA
MSLILIGLVVGLILGLFGAGGTILAVPFLIFGLDMDPKMAIPISMFAVAASSIIGSISALINKQVRYRAASLMAFFAMLISPLGILAGQYLSKDPLMIIFALLLMWSGIKPLITKAEKSPQHNAQSEEMFPCEINENTKRIRWNTKCARALSFTGSITGFLSGLLGVGGGFIIVPALKKFTNIHLNNIFPTSVAVIAIIASYNSVIFLYKGLLNFHYGVLFCVGTTLGMLVSRYLNINTAKIDVGFSYFLIVIAMFLILKTIWL